VRAFTWLGHVQAGFGQWALPSTRDTAGYWAGLAVVTRNVSDFAHAPVVLLNPWDIAPSAQ